MTDVDICVVGGGIVGLAVARALALGDSPLSVRVLEAEPELARHQTGHNSGVIHAGIYYKPGSLKARLCVEGAAAMWAFCAEHDVIAERCGKLIVARDPSEIPALDELERRGRANGVPGLRRLGSSEIAEVEPHARGAAALHSPATGIVDYAAVARAIAAQLRDRGVEVHTCARVTGLDTDSRGVSVSIARTAAARGSGPRAASDVPRRARPAEAPPETHRQGTQTPALSGAEDAEALRARFVVTCAGLGADRLAVASGADPDPRVVPFRGAYLRLAPAKRHLVRGLIYPVPDPSLPFLGVHLTRHLDGEVSIGPTALLSPSGLRRTLSWPGTWRMARRWWRTGLTEVHTAARPGALARGAAEYVPGIERADVSPYFTGTRAQAIGRDGALLDDFAFSESERALHVRNAPSPAGTAAFAIGDEIAARVRARMR